MSFTIDLYSFNLTRCVRINKTSSLSFNLAHVQEFNGINTGLRISLQPRTVYEKTSEQKLGSIHGYFNLVQCTRQ